MKLFECIVDDGSNVFKTTTPAQNKKELLSIYGGNGDFISIKDVTKNYLNMDSLTRINDDLAKMNWGETERKLIVALIERHLISAGTYGN